MHHIRLLVVEDEQKELKLWQQQIERYNAMHEGEVSAEFARSAEEARERIFFNKFDAAIIDIRLEGDGKCRDPGLQDGNAIREMILESEVIITAHITGEPGRVTPSTAGHQALIKTFVKADDDASEKTVYEDILEWVGSKSDLLETIAESKSIIKNRVARLFFASIWPRWLQWNSAENATQEFVAKSLSRHIASHLYNELLEGSDGKVHPEEWYFLPPKSGRFRTGDILRVDEELHIVVTPRCDLERIAEGDFLLLAKLNDISHSWRKARDQLEQKIEKIQNDINSAKQEEDLARVDRLSEKIQKANGEFRKEFYGHSRNKSNLHFLPPIQTDKDQLDKDQVIGPFYVDFSQISSLACGSAQYSSAEKAKVAMLASEFLPELSQRLGAYISRIGSPDYSHIY